MANRFHSIAWQLIDFWTNTYPLIYRMKSALKLKPIKFPLSQHSSQKSGDKINLWEIRCFCRALKSMLKENFIIILDINICLRSCVTIYHFSHNNPMSLTTHHIPSFHFITFPMLTTDGWRLIIMLTCLWFRNSTQRLSDCVWLCDSDLKTYVHCTHIFRKINSSNRKEAQKCLMNFIRKTLSMFDAYRIQTIERKS